jgi:hypothetical protein
MEINNKYKNKMIINQLIITTADKGKKTLVILTQEKNHISDMLMTLYMTKTKQTLKEFNN